MFSCLALVAALLAGRALASKPGFEPDTCSESSGPALFQRGKRPEALLASDVQEEAGDFCCWWAPDSNNMCGTCQSKAPADNWCAKSKTNCNTCSDGKAAWCSSAPAAPQGSPSGGSGSPFCCWWGKDSNDMCGSCSAKAPTGNWCAQSESQCKECMGGKASWCGGGGGAAPGAAVGQGGTLMIMSYNTEYKGYKDGRVWGFGGLIKSVGPAIVGTQECQNKNQLAQAAGYKVVPGTDFQNPILYNPGKVSYEDGSGGWQPVTSDKYSARTITWATFKLGGVKILFFNTHLPHDHGNAHSHDTHAQIANVILQKRREWSFGDGPTVVTGDMNPHASTRNSQGTLEDVLIRGGFFKAYASQHTLRNYDQIFATSAHFTASDGRDSGKGGSDHTSVVVDLTLKR